MADITIPGISDKYKTNDLVKSLVEVEKIPLKREQDKIETLKTEQANWRRVNQYMTSLRESSRILYSFDNPFNDRTTSSSDEYAVTATANRDANLESFNVDVIQTAECDRFLSSEIDKNLQIPSGTYKFSVGEKTVSYKWKGGKLSEFVEGLNKRSNGLIKASLIGVSKDKTSLLIESLKPGLDNKLVFSDQAFNLAYDLNIIQDAKTKSSNFNKNETIETLSMKEIKIPDEVKKSKGNVLTFTIHAENVEDVVLKKQAQNESSNIDKETDENTNATNSTGFPEMPFAGSMTYKDITINNESSIINMDSQPNTDENNKLQNEPESPVTDQKIVFVKLTDGTVKELESLDENFSDKKYTINLSDYENIDSILVTNKNTARKVSILNIKSFNPNLNAETEPVNPISTAQNAKIKYEGIPIERGSNSIDDVIPNITLELHSPTEKTATIKVENNIESSKDAIITFVGNYNRLIAELNILTQLKPEIIDELDYFSDDEKEEAMKRLGALQDDFSIKNDKTTLQQIMTSSYAFTEESKIRTLSQLGISTKSTMGGSVSQAQMRGYLEIDEKKLDEALNSSMIDIKNLFGYDTDGDKVIDSGIAYSIDKNLQTYVQIGGILAMKNSTIEREISNTESKIKRLEDQIADKEISLKKKYGNMESTLNSLQSQSNSISNFANQGNNKN